MKLLSGLRPFTRILICVVLMTSALTVYWKARYQGIREDARRHEKSLAELRNAVKQAEHRVQKLRYEAVESRRWAAYADVLDEQSTGRSLRDVLATCGTGAGPDVEVRGLRFERVPGGDGFRRLKVSFRLDGPYSELMRVLHELDRAFPPIEFTSATLKVPENGEEEAKEDVSAELEGVIHEPL